MSTEPIKKPSKLYVVATVGNTPEGLDKNPDKEYISTSRVGVGFACMDVALKGQTFRLHVWPDAAWSLEWCPRRWKEADVSDNWKLLASGFGSARRQKHEEGK